MTDREIQMVAAHKAGRAFAQSNPRDALIDALNYAEQLYLDKDTQDAFVSGYIGEKRRIRARSKDMKERAG